MVRSDMIALKSRVELFGVPARQGGDDVLIVLLRRRRARRRLRQGMPQMVCRHDSLSHIRNTSVGGTAKAQQNSFDDGGVVE